MIKAPARVSQHEKDKHNMTHIPYRAWCPICVRARGRNEQHKKADKDEKEIEKSTVTRISMDYFFMSELD